MEPPSEVIIRAVKSRSRAWKDNLMGESVRLRGGLAISKPEL